MSRVTQVTGEVSEHWVEHGLTHLHLEKVGKKVAASGTRGRYLLDEAGLEDALDRYWEALQ